MREADKSSLRGTPLLIALGVVLAIVSLVMVNRYTDWFELRVGSGTATAMALAADKAPATK